MPIGPQKMAPTGRLSEGSQNLESRTAFFSTYQSPPEYRSIPLGPAAGAADDLPRYNDDKTTLLSPTLDRELEYFHAVAAGEIPPQQSAAPILVLNLFRATQTHIDPIAERLTIGAAVGAPHYALHATTSSTSINEFNKLLITRRHPIRASWTDVCVSEIQPKLNLLSQGIMLIAKITRYAVQYYLTWEESKGYYSLWRDTGEAVVHILCDGWRSLDDTGKGVIRVGIEIFPRMPI